LYTHRVENNFTTHRLARLASHRHGLPAWGRAGARIPRLGYSVRLP
jgi:hypothetical protein